MDAKEDELDKVKSDITVAQSDADAVQAEIDAQNEIIAQIQAEEARKKAEEEKRRQEAEENGTTPDTTPGDVYSGGAFVWPCPSSTRVTSDYGTRLSPTQGASSNHKGLDIGASYGASIASAEFVSSLISSIFLPLIIRDWILGQAMVQVLWRRQMERFPMQAIIMEWATM